MNATRILPVILMVFAGLVTSSAHAIAGPVPVACGTAIDDYFSGRRPGARLKVVGTRVIARQGTVLSSFSMAQGYSLVTTPLGTAGSAAMRLFTANKGSSNYDGVFSEVFPDRGNSAVDSTEFWVYRTGEVWMRFLTWSPTWMQLQNVACYRGPENQTIITANSDSTSAGFGYDFWTFALQGEL